MKKPLIGIIPLVDRERESYWMLPGYMKGIEEAGGIPVMLPLTSDREALEKLVNYFDGFLFTGGHDVSPAVYREAVFEKCGECCPERDEMEAALLPIILEEDKPALGICRGLQLFNALLGGNTAPGSWKRQTSPLWTVFCLLITRIRLYRKLLGKNWSCGRKR